MRRYDHPPRRGIRYRNRIGAYAVIWRDGRILLTYEDLGAGEWQLPGGGVDPGESAIRAIARETLEETGWSVAVGPRIGAYLRFAFMDGYGFHARKVCLVHEARALRRWGPPAEPQHSAHWLAPLDALARLSNDGDRAMLGRFLGLATAAPPVSQSRRRA